MHNCAMHFNILVISVNEADFISLVYTSIYEKHAKQARADMTLEKLSSYLSDK